MELELEVMIRTRTRGIDRFGVGGELELEVDWN